ncbi:hypothetical protein K449DRAFT_114097 [Hypoxylon sp. EC38]|nr:hypothetical protein K449DRAFT_114097 [Hypoxylon sp. EC38]
MSYRNRRYYKLGQRLRLEAKAMKDVKTPPPDTFERQGVFPLESLPPELVSNVVSFLDPADAGSLRLTNRKVSKMATRGSFSTRFIQSRSIKLTTHNLEKFICITSKPGLPCLIQHLTIHGIMYPNRRTRRENNAVSFQVLEDERLEVQQLLAQAFRNLLQNSEYHGLSSLSFSVAVTEKGWCQQRVEFRSWKTVWLAAVSSFTTTMVALKESGLPVSHINLFEHLYGCSLQVHTFVNFTRRLESGDDTFSSLKELSLSLSAPPRTRPKLLLGTKNDSPLIFDLGYESQAWYSLNALQSILRWMRFLPRLEELNLRWYNLGPWNTYQSASPLFIPLNHPDVGACLTLSLDMNVQDLVHLKKCTLQGVFVSAHCLLDFIKSVNPTSLTLADIHLVTGTYRGILEYLTDINSPIRAYCLDDLYEGSVGTWSKLVHFEVPGKPKFTYKQNGGLRPSTLERSGADVKDDTVDYYTQEKMDIGSFEFGAWRMDKKLRFGPLEPGKHK